jgi:hypothetical protein
MCDQNVLSRKNMIDVHVICLMHYNDSSSSMWYLFLLKYPLIIYYLKKYILGVIFMPSTKCLYWNTSYLIQYQYLREDKIVD